MFSIESVLKARQKSATTTLTCTFLFIARFITRHGPTGTDWRSTGWSQMESAAATLTPVNLVRYRSTGRYAIQPMNIPLQAPSFWTSVYTRGIGNRQNLSPPSISCPRVIFTPMGTPFLSGVYTRFSRFLMAVFSEILSLCFLNTHWKAIYHHRCKSEQT